MSELTDIVQAISPAVLHIFYAEAEEWNRTAVLPGGSVLRQLARQAYALDSVSILHLNDVAQCVYREIARRAVAAHEQGPSESYQAGLHAGRRQGYEAAAYDYGIWKDGEVRIGVMGRSLQTVMERFDHPGFRPTLGWPE